MLLNSYYYEHRPYRGNSPLNLVFDRYPEEALTYNPAIDPEIQSTFNATEIADLSFHLAQWKQDYAQSHGQTVTGDFWATLGTVVVLGGAAEGPSCLDMFGPGGGLHEAASGLGELGEAVGVGRTHNTVETDGTSDIGSPSTSETDGTSDIGSPSTSPSRPLASPFYEVGFEAKLQPGQDYPGVSDARHFAEANHQLYDKMQADPAFAQTLEELYPGIIEGVQPGPRGAFPRRAPTPDVT